MTDQGYATEPNGTPVDQLTGGPDESQIDPSDPAAPNYELIARLRSPLTPREIMIAPVRSGYVGQDHPIDPKFLPRSGAELLPNVTVEQVYDAVATNRSGARLRRPMQWSCRADRRWTR